MISKIIILGLIYLSAIECANILILEGAASPSHHVWMGTLNRALASRGHNVTSLSMDVDKEATKGLTYLHMEDMYNNEDFGMDQYMEFDQLSPFLKFFMLCTFFHDDFIKSQKTNGFKALFNYPNDFKFDLIIFDHLASPGYLMFAEKFGNPPIISASAYSVIFQSNIITGSPSFPAFIPNHFMDEVRESFGSRLESFVTYSIMYLFDELYTYPQVDKYIKTVLPNAKPTKEILKSIKIQLINYNPVQDFVQPIMPSVIPVGGLQITPPKNLTLELEKIYSKAPKGVVYFSLGSNVKSELLGLERLKEIIEALRALPDYVFLWKIDATGLEIDLPKNVFIRKWFPQNDILADSRTVLFISHAGGLSTQECTWYGVPMLAFPFMLDQFPNAEKMVKSGMGLQLAIKNIEKDSLRETILELLTNPTYRQQAQKRSKNMQDQPERPLDRALWWIDYVLRNPDIAFLRNTKLQEMNILVKHSIDVIAFLIIVDLFLIGLVVKLCLYCYRRRKAGKSAKVKKQ